MRREYVLEVDGVPVRAVYDDECVEGVLVPLLHRWTCMRAERGRRVVAFLCAPPGTGKTTLACMLEALSRERAGVCGIQVASLDGFHLHQSELESRWACVEGRRTRLADVKGTLETFDLDGLLAKLEELRAGGPVSWPAYSRCIHDVVELAEALDDGHVLLLDDVARGKDEGGDDDGRDEDIEETHNALHSVRTDGPLSV